MTATLPISIGPPHDRCRHSATVHDVNWSTLDNNGAPIVNWFNVTLDGKLTLNDWQLLDELGADAHKIAYEEACRIAAREAYDNARELSEEIRWAEARR